MKTVKQTPRKEVTRRPIDPFGNDIFDIIDHHYTYERGRDDATKEIREKLGPAARELISELTNTHQRVKSKEKDIETLKKIRALEASQDLRELVKLREALNEIIAPKDEKTSPETWTFPDDRGRVLVRGKTKEELVQGIFAKLEGGGGDALRAFWRLKNMTAETGPINPTKELFLGMVKSSKSPQDLVKRLAKDRPRAVEEFTNYIWLDPVVKKFLRIPIY